MAIEVYVIKYADTTLRVGDIMEGGDYSVRLPITLCYYLVRVQDRNILVDTGCDTLPGFVLTNFVRPDLALMQVGLLPEEITDVVITHPHRDHIEGIGYYKNATAYMSKETYCQGKDSIPEGMTVHTFEKEFTFDEGIRLVQWDGHCAGSAFVEIRLGDKIHILAGDECYTDRNIREKLPTGAAWDKQQAKRFVEIYSGSDYVVHTCHDISLKTERVV
ncbi:MAG: MBL fold metallo-hydrolase [Oscillospiraceae bacterium]|nr:MBL fold metallo-hydrolase [Oscillospiraceae bacterium]